jgi:ABC-2 type transport system permease protein
MIAAGILLPSFLGGGSDDATTPPEATKVAIGPGVTGIDALRGSAGFDLREAATAEEAVAAVESGEVDAALIATTAATPNALPLTLVAASDPPGDVLGALTIAPAVSLLDPSPFGPLPIGYVASLVFGVLFLWVALLFGQTIAQNTVIEKQTRIVEILLAAVPARALLGGKVVGNSILALGETVIMAATALVCLKLSGSEAALSTMAGPILWYIPFFVIGFVFLASLFAGVAALVSRLEDVSTAVTPISFLIMIPYVLVLAFNSEETVMMVCSYIPIVSTIAMPVRMMESGAAWWEAIISLAILIVTTLGAIAAGARVYSYSLLQTGKRIKFLTALRAKN